MQSTRASTNFGLVQAGIVLTTLITVFIHWWINLSIGGYLFILNGLGYLVLLAALFIPKSTLRRFLPVKQAERFRPFMRYVMIAYTMLTILLWAAIGTRSTRAYVDKLAEALLVVLLWFDRSRN